MNKLPKMWINAIVVATVAACLAATTRSSGAAGPRRRSPPKIQDAKDIKAFVSRSDQVRSNHRELW